MNILFVINALEIGGAETFLMRLMKQLALLNHQTYIYVLYPQLNNSSFSETFYNETHAVNIPEAKVPGKTLSFFLNKINAISTRLGYHDLYKDYLLKRRRKHFKRLLVEKYKIDLMNSHLYSSDIFCLEFLKPILKIPHVITMQGCYESVIALNDQAAIHKAVMAIESSSALTYVADKNLDFLKFSKISLPKINCKIYNGLPLPDLGDSLHRNEYGISENDFVIGQISRSIETKGMEISIRAVEFLVENRGLSNLKLFIIGPENEYYIKLRSKYENKDYIKFPGATNNPIEWIGMFNIGILPTYFPSESCPSSIIEYISCGKPVISTTIGEIANMIDVDGLKSGLLVPFNLDNGKPAISDIADAIETYYKENELYSNHSKLAIKAFGKFEISKTADLYIKVFNSVLKKTDN